MNVLRRIFGGGNRFDRYYGDILGSGSGYPTADEARRDLARYDQEVGRFTWVR